MLIFSSSQLHIFLQRFTFCYQLKITWLSADAFSLPNQNVWVSYIKLFNFPQKLDLGIIIILFLAPNFVRSRKGIKQFKANSFFILASKMLKVHCQELNCLCNWIMTDLYVQKTNQILKLDQPPQNLLNLSVKLKFLLF